MQSIYASIKAQYDKGLADPLEVQEVVRKLHPHKIVGLGYVQNCLRTIRAADDDGPRTGVHFPGRDPTAGEVL